MQNEFGGCIMFDNIGGKIKTLAKVVCWIGIIACIITGIVLMATDDDLILVGILTAVVGSLLSWVSSFILYGFGQLVENSDTIANRNVNSHSNSTNSSNSVPHSSSVDFSSAKHEAGKCEMCDADNVDVVYCKIVDDMGTRYRKLCSDCQSKYNATPTK